MLESSNVLRPSNKCATRDGVNAEVNVNVHVLIDIVDDT